MLAVAAALAGLRRRRRRPPVARPLPAPGGEASSETEVRS
jgi:hypothetical protein